MIIYFVLISAYLLGSIPFGYLIGRKAGKMDIRTEGSGNIGATNVARVIGLKWGVLVFVLDLLKGVLPPLILLALTSSSKPFLFIFAGLAAVCGHNWPLFLGFKGGKGVSTSLGAVIGLCLVFPDFWLSVIGALASWTVLFLLFRIVSIASLSAAAVFFALSLVAAVPFELKIFSLVLFGFIVLRHRSNIKSLISKKEHRF